MDDHDVQQLVTLLEKIIKVVLPIIIVLVAYISWLLLSRHWAL